jgi:uncharacterized membrane protein
MGAPEHPASTAASADSADSGEPVVFDAVLTPHRSLSPVGFFLLMSAVALVGFAWGAAFLLIGAWPIFGFCGIEIGLFFLMFQLSYRSARMFERLHLTPSCLTVERHDPRGRVRRWRFQPAWLRVAIDDPPKHDSRLTVSSHGRSLAIGSFLSAEERLDLAHALRAALDRSRAPQPAGSL